MALQGACHQHVGETDVSARYYSLGLAESPDNVELLTARGTLLYATSTQAVQDVDRAVELATPHVRPYLFLAHHYLLTGRFDACRATCGAGLRLPAADEVRSVMEELRGVTLAELEFPARYVRKSFKAASGSTPVTNRPGETWPRSGPPPPALPRPPRRSGVRARARRSEGYALLGDGGGWPPDLNILHAVAAI